MADDDMRYCPGRCGYRRAPHEIDRAYVNIACPRCGKFNIKDFKPADPPKIIEPVQDYHGSWMLDFGGEG